MMLFVLSRFMRRGTKEEKRYARKHYFHANVRERESMISKIFHPIHYHHAVWSYE